MSEIAVDEKHRITLPKELREQLGISPGTVLEAEYRDGDIVLKPKLPLRRPTEALWGIAKGIVEESPKKVARKAIATITDNR